MKVVPIASNAIALEIQDMNGNLIGVFEIRTIIGQGLELRVIKKKFTQETGLKPETIKAKWTEIGVNLT